MAQKQKRPSPLDEPPTASSSDSEEDQQPSSQRRDEEEEEDDDDEEASSEEQEDDDDDDEEEDVQRSSRVQPASKNPPPPPTNTNSHPKTASSESDTETDSGSDSESAPPPAANPKVKPLASKPMEQTPKAKPQSSTAAATRSASASKRPAENNGHVSEPKRAKKKGTNASDDEAEEDGKKSGDDSKKLFQRLWSEEDEIAILKGMVEFTSKTGGDPLKYANAFHDFVKKSLQADASSNQLKQKIRRLKKKFETNAGKGKNGEGPSFSKPHDQKCFELSKKVWGNSGGEEKAKTNGKAGKSPKKEASSRNVSVASTKPKPKPDPKSEPKSDLMAMDSKEAGKMDIDEKPDTTSHLMEVIRLDKGLSGLNEDVVKRGVELIEASKRAELEEEWKELQVAELELYVKRAELIANQARLILEAYKSSNH